MSSFERPNFAWIRLACAAADEGAQRARRSLAKTDGHVGSGARACRTMTHMLHETPQVATKATSSVIRIHAADMSASSVVISPTPDHRATRWLSR